MENEKVKTKEMIYVSGHRGNGSKKSPGIEEGSTEQTNSVI